MSNYNYFIDKLNFKLDKVIIFEVGARDCLDSLTLSKISNSRIFSYEPNPLMKETCEKNSNKNNNIQFFNFGLGEEESSRDFYFYNQKRKLDISVYVGCSGFLKRTDNQNQIKIPNIKISTLKTEMEKNNIDFIDLLCLDVQGYELNVLKGARDKIKNIKYIIMEQPRGVNQGNTNKVEKIDNLEHPYIGSPNLEEINYFMKENNFEKILSKQENLLEDNCLYINKLYKI